MKPIIAQWAIPGQCPVNDRIAIPFTVQVQLYIFFQISFVATIDYCITFHWVEKITKLIIVLILKHMRNFVFRYFIGP